MPTPTASKKKSPARKSLTPIFLFLQWLLFSSFAVWTGLMLGSWLTPRVASTLAGNEDSLFPYIVLLSLGLTLGVVQAVLLGKVLPESPRWFRYTLAGCVGAMLVMGLPGLVGYSASGVAGSALLMAAAGAVVGLGQWGLLRRHFRQAWLWIPAAALGALSFVLLAVTPAAETNEFVVRGTLYGLISAVPAGLVLLWIVRPGNTLP